MTIQIIITDPHQTGAAELMAIAGFLTAIAQGPKEFEFTLGQPGEAVQLNEQMDHINNPLAAFGKSPLPSGVPSPQHQASAPSTVAAVPSPTVPEAPPATSALASVPPPPAANNVVTPAAASPNHVETDKNGLPWDGRIHASTKAKLADGSWRQRRNVDAALVTSVEAELRKVMAIPAAPASTTPDVWTQPGEVPPPPPSVPAYPAFMQRVTEAVAANRLTKEQVQRIADGLGLPIITMLSSRPDMVAQANTLLDLELG